MFKLLKNLGKKEWILVAICFLLVIGGVWLELRMPDYMSEITVLVQTKGSKMQEIIKNGLFMLGCALRKFNIIHYCWISSIRNICNTFNEY